MNRAQDYDRFSAAITATAEAYNVQLTRERILIYWEDLAEFDIAEVVAAFTTRRRTGEFFPTIAALRDTILGSPADRAVLAWDRFLTAVRHHGPYVSVDFRDPVLHTCIEAMGGWPTAASIESAPETLGYRQHEFIQHYRAYQRRLPGPAKDHLPGIFEITNQETRGHWLHGHDHVDHVLVLADDGKQLIDRRRAYELPAAPHAVPLPETITPELGPVTESDETTRTLPSGAEVTHKPAALRTLLDAVLPGVQEDLVRQRARAARSDETAERTAEFWRDVERLKRPEGE